MPDNKSFLWKFTRKPDVMSQITLVVDALDEKINEKIKPKKNDSETVKPVLDINHALDGVFRESGNGSLITDFLKSGSLDKDIIGVNDLVGILKKLMPLTLDSKKIQHSDKKEVESLKRIYSKGLADYTVKKEDTPAEAKAKKEAEAKVKEEFNWNAKVILKRNPALEALFKNIVKCMAYGNLSIDAMAKSIPSTMPLFLGRELSADELKSDVQLKLLESFLAEKLLENQSLSKKYMRKYPEDTAFAEKFKEKYTPFSDDEKKALEAKKPLGPK